MLSPLKLNARSSGVLGNFSRIYSSVSVDSRSLVTFPSYARQLRKTASSKIVTNRSLRCRLQKEAVVHVEVCRSCQSEERETRLKLSTTERRIHCDRTVPTCSQCSRSKRSCQGYALRLSWPKTGDGRRAIVATSSFRRPARQFSNASMVHTTAWDIEMHFYLTSSSQKGKLATYLDTHLPMYYTRG